MKSSDDTYKVNLFRPRSGRMRGEVSAILTVLLVWGVAAFGFQIWLALSSCSSGKSFLETFTFFNLPFHYWFTAQMLPLIFIIICILFNLFIDRLTVRQSGEREGHHE